MTMPTKIGTADAKKVTLAMVSQPVHRAMMEVAISTHPTVNATFPGPFSIIAASSFSGSF
ncbi:MAG: hypothetical protein ACN6OP_05245 [Pseudomonadales bacterium]